MIDVLSFILGGAAGALAAGVGWALRRWSARRRPGLPPSWVIDPPSVVSSSDPASGTDPDRSDPVRPASRSVVPPPVPVTRAEVSLSERIVVQLAREGRLDPDAPAAPTRTQRGLATALESSQGAVSKVLGRLVAAGVISQDRRHIRGGSQRMKVYDLTRRGEYLAREVASRRNLDLLPTREPVPLSRNVSADGDAWTGEPASVRPGDPASRWPEPP